MKKKEASSEEKARRNRIFGWAVFVVIINAIQLKYPNTVTQIIAMVGTVYALYRLVVYDNKKNRLSRKFYNWKGEWKGDQTKNK